MNSLGKSTSVLVISSCLLFGCAATDKRFGDEQWYQKTRETSDKVVAMTKSTAASTYKRAQKYLEEKELLKTFHDTGEHSEAAVLEVLHRAAGTTKAAQPGKPAKPGTPPATAGTPKPAKPGTPPGGAIPPPPAKSGGPAGPKPPVVAGGPARVPDHYEGDYRWPLDAGIISSEFGERWGKQHKGLDIAADTGEAVYAVASGEVIYASDGMRGYGNVVIVKHDHTITSLYAHNSELKVKQGDQVKQGDLIALLGSTGHSTGPHVHFEFRNGDVAVNPHTLLPAQKNPEAVPARAADVEESRDGSVRVAGVTTRR